MASPARMVPSPFGRATPRIMADHAIRARRQPVAVPGRAARRDAPTARIEDLTRNSSAPSSASMNPSTSCPTKHQSLPTSISHRSERPSRPSCRLRRSARLVRLSARKAARTGRSRQSGGHQFGSSRRWIGWRRCRWGVPSVEAYHWRRVASHSADRLVAARGPPEFRETNRPASWPHRTACLRGAPAADRRCPGVRARAGGSRRRNADQPRER
jgi:hypothetical protein